MGVSDFFDPLTDYEDLRQNDYSQPEIAFIRRVETTAGDDNEDLKKALQSYVLAGGTKLWRLAQDPQRYNVEQFKHHTMLVHTSQRKGEHASLAERLQDLWNECAFNAPKGLADLQKLWDQDHAKVCAAQGTEIAPTAFTELIPYLSEAIKRIEKGPSIFLVVNSDTTEAPDFSAAPVWKIIVGGNKLSRGYTIEGLTVSYYRRVAGTADTLMQMGRWFGFRPGYRDLVRVFLGVADGPHHDTDLVSLFKEVCFMEERFRKEIKRYVRTPGAPRITPKEIPPLISVSGDLPPTASNKMFNAVLASKNFGGRWSMLTLTPAEVATIQRNIDTLARLLKLAKPLGRSALGGNLKAGGKIEADTLIFETTNGQLIAFLTDYRWLEADYNYPKRPADVGLQLEFLEKQKHGVTSWLIVAPQRRDSFGPALEFDGVELSVKERHRVGGRRFQVFGESAHRIVAEYLAGIEDGNSQLQPSASTKALRNEHRGVVLLYPVREQPKDKASVGFELLFPKNGLAYDLNFTVRRKDEAETVVVPNPKNPRSDSAASNRAP